MVRAGDAGDAVRLIAGGEALVEYGGGHHVTLKEGEGEMALLERRRRGRTRRRPRPIAGSMCSTVRPWRVSAADIRDPSASRRGASSRRCQRLSLLFRTRKAGSANLRSLGRGALRHIYYPKMTILSRKPAVEERLARRRPGGSWS